MKRLGRRVGSLALARGLMEALWHLTAIEAPAGDIGKLSDEDIAMAIEWENDPTDLVNILVDVGFLDRSDEHRLLVHDWYDHCEDSVHMALARSTAFFATGQQPKTSRFAKDERTRIEASYELVRVPSVLETHRERTVSARQAHSMPCLAKPSHPMPSHAQPVVPPAALPTTDDPNPVIAAFEQRMGRRVPEHNGEGRAIREWYWAYRERPPIEIDGSQIEPDVFLDSILKLFLERKMDGVPKSWLKWIQSVEDRCRMSKVWPNQYREAVSVKPEIVRDKIDFSKL